MCIYMYVCMYVYVYVSFEKVSLKYQIRRIRFWFKSIHVNYVYRSLHFVALFPVKTPLST